MADAKFKKDQIPWNKGKKGIYSEETKRKMREGRNRAWSNPDLRKRQSKLTKEGMANPEVRKKISDAKKGKPSPNKGKKTGKPSWMKGKTHSEESRRKMTEASKKKWSNPEYKKRMSEVHKGKPSPKKGTHPSPQTLKRLSDSHKGQVSWMKGKTHSENTRNKISENTKKSMSNPEIKRKFIEANRKRYLVPESLEKIKRHSRETILRLFESGSFPKQTNTKPERQIKEELLKRGYKEGKDFIHQYKFMNKFMCDFCFPNQKVIIEVDGDFWHANPNKYPEGSELHKHQLKGRSRDKSKNAYISKVDNSSWNLIRFWEEDINKNVSECVDRVEKVLAKKIDLSKS